METGILFQFKDLGLIAACFLSACGSAAGAGVAGMAAIGAWKKNFTQNKNASFLLVALTGAPLTQTIYGYIVMNKMVELAKGSQHLWGIGAFAGAAIGLSAYYQGKCAACACDALGEIDKGFGNYLAILGIVETVALFVMVFTLIILGKLAGA
ncbi:MAG: V-type ATP synthase subunit K [Candidatus Omnitrophica bacterium]|nr:V-type ATP synthase subunit K [Candidatus Omnitrophota bacterium]MBU4303778.1 V-type ATP synthase subunit K [Candidatus Omnitrophota bacterium]MBU4418392.1 V-type ATP synthase subunit K [Candidatus Omnitrophota bacterium]MBU4468586.1 V-type ATP synthase subunit K [Candidatus Omnitrophota bacterium]MCG2708657.1 V-type ATP synthase subunit K [Candidatus Omnitrophota bacterium]